MKKLIITLLLALPFMVKAQVYDLKAYKQFRLNKDVYSTDSGKRVMVNGIRQATLTDVNKKVDSTIKKTYFPLDITTDFYNAGTDPSPRLGATIAILPAISASITITAKNQIIPIASGTFNQALPTGGATAFSIEFYNRGSGTVTLTYNGTTLRNLTGGTALRPNYLKFTWNPNDNTYLTH